MGTQVKRRLTEWGTRHVPLSFWERHSHLENLDFLYTALKAALKGTGLYERGYKNALDLQVNYKELELENLPPGFDGLKILFMTDLHLDGMDDLLDAVVKRIRCIKADICLLGGDFRFQMHGPIQPVLSIIKKMVSSIQTPLGVFSVLGNHDPVEIVPGLEKMGVRTLVNKSISIKILKDQIWLVGVDDPHYYKCHDIDKAFRAVPDDAFVIFLVHSPELYRQAAEKNANLYLCGHTHHGQIRLPFLGPIIKHCPVPRSFVGGLWKYKTMWGYTGAGVGSSGTTVRFLCPPEITVFSLKRKID